MTVSNVTRRAGPFVGNGSIKAFPFPFKVFNERQVLVYESDNGVTDTELAYGTDYYVTLDAEAGGTVTLTAPLAVGKRLAILSNVPYDQQMVLTNRGGFYPTVINDEADKLCAQIQQIFELATRHLTVPATSDKTSEEVLTEVLDTAANASKYAEEAKVTLEEAKTTKAQVDDTAKTVAEQAEQVDAQTKVIVALNEDGTLDTVAGLEDELKAIAPNAIGIGAVGQDLLSDDSYTKKVADGIADVAVVGSNITAVRTDAQNIESIRLVAADLGAEIDSTFQHDFGVWGVDDTIPELDNTGKLSQVVTKLAAIENVSDNMESVTGAITASAEAKQAASSALASEARIQALEDQIREIISTNYVAISEGQ